MSRLIFLIDDDEDEKEIFEEAILLSGVPFQLAYMNSVVKALELLDKRNPNSIFIDMNMPGVDGLRGIGILRAIEKLKDIPIVMYSNGINSTLCAQAIKTGASDCLRKPSSVKELSDFLRAHFD